MAALYKHAQHGFRLKYTIFFPDGTKKEKYRHCKKKDTLILALQDIEKLETLSLHGKLTTELIVYALHQKYISNEEAQALAPQKKLCTVNITWDTLADVWERHLVKVGSETTRRVYPYIVRPILKHFKGTNPAHTQPKDIEDFLHAMRLGGRAKATCNKYLSALRIMFSYLVQEGIIDLNPARQIKDFTGLDERVPRVIYPAELKTFFSLIQQNAHLLYGYFAEMLLFYLYTGLRRNELLKLKTSDINLSHKYIRVEKTKNNKERIVELHPRLVPVVESVKAKNGQHKGQYLFGGKETPLCRPDAITRAFSRAISGNLPAGITLHSMRHTFITYLLKSGVDLKKVQSTAGHKKLSTTYRYLHLIESKNTVSKIDFEADIEG